MAGGIDYLEATRTITLAGGLAYAAVSDLRSREVTDHLWQVLGVAGLVFGLVAFAPAGPVPFALWLLVAVFVVQHVFPWDDALRGPAARFAPWIEGVTYLAVLLLTGAAVVSYGIGASAVPVAILAVLASVLLARALFELGVLYGGADAKALMVTGLVVPLFAVPLLLAPPSTATLLSFLPFSITVLTNAAFFSIFVPLAIAVRNVRRGEFTLRRGFTGYTMAVADLPRRFVWVRDPLSGHDSLADDAETSEEDARRRTEIARALAAEGIRRVWVTPQIPFLVVMAAGGFAGLLAGNLLLDLFTLL